jgi:hypothetical protein
VAGTTYSKRIQYSTVSVLFERGDADLLQMILDEQRTTFGNEPDAYLRGLGFTDDGVKKILVMVGISAA